MGTFIMLGTLFGLIILIFALVYRFDPEARSDSDRAVDKNSNNDPVVGDKS